MSTAAERRRARQFVPDLPEEFVRKLSEEGKSVLSFDEFLKEYKKFSQSKVKKRP